MEKTILAVNCGRVGRRNTMVQKRLLPLKQGQTSIYDIRTQPKNGLPVCER